MLLLTRQPYHSPAARVGIGLLVFLAYFGKTLVAAGMDQTRGGLKNDVLHLYK